MLLQSRYQVLENALVFSLNRMYFIITALIVSNKSAIEVTFILTYYKGSEKRLCPNKLGTITNIAK